MTFVTYFDGACEPINPGGTASYGAVILQDRRRIWECSELYHPPKGHEHETSNNVAEYSALIAVLEWFAERELFDAEITIYGDSNLVIQQIFGNWRIKKGLYLPLAHKARKLLQHFTNIRGEWRPRERNMMADELSKAALRQAGVKLTLQPD